MKYKGKNIDGVHIEGGETTFVGDNRGNSSKIGGEHHAEPIRAIRSRRKGMSVSQKEFDDNWDRIFNKDKV